MLNGLKSNIILSKIFDYLQEKTFLEIIRYNKKLQKSTKTSINDYKSFHNIKIELIPTENFKVGDIFINFIDERSSFHIFFDNSDEEIKLNYFTKIEKISKIRITLDTNIKSLRGLFKECKCLKEIYFTKFDNKNITDLGEMFQGCISLTKLDISKLNIDKDKIINLSIINNQGIDELKDKIVELFKLNELETKDPTYLNNTRSISILKNCLKKTEEIEESLKNNLPIDMIELDIKAIWEELGKINGSTYEEELLDEMFKRFCLGK